MIWFTLGGPALAGVKVRMNDAARAAFRQASRAIRAGLLGASCAFRQQTDPSLFPAMREVRGPGGQVLALIRAPGVLAFILPILWYSVFAPNKNPARGCIARLAGRQAKTIDLPMTIFGIALPIAFDLIPLHLAVQLTGGKHKDTA